MTTDPPGSMMVVNDIVVVYTWPFEVALDERGRLVKGFYEGKKKKNEKKKKRKEREATTITLADQKTKKKRLKSKSPIPEPCNARCTKQRFVLPWFCTFCHKRKPSRFHRPVTHLIDGRYFWSVTNPEDNPQLGGSGWLVINMVLLVCHMGVLGKKMVGREVVIHGGTWGKRGQR